MVEVEPYRLATHVKYTQYIKNESNTKQNLKKYYKTTCKNNLFILLKWNDKKWECLH